MPKLKCKGTTSPQAQLYNMLKDNFVPEFEAEWTKKERQRQKELMYASMPRRVSSRQQRLLEHQAERAKEEEVQRQRDEELRLVRLAEQERRTAARKEAESVARLEARQTAIRLRNDERVRRKYERDGTRDDEEDGDGAAEGGGGEAVTEWHDKTQRVHSALLRHGNAWCFTMPVTEDIAPGYFTIIQNPRDLGTIKEELEQLSYATLEEYVADVFLVFENCRIYNGAIAEVTQLGDLSEEFFVQKMCKAFPGFSEGIGK